MLTLEEIRRRVNSAEDLHSIARAMKALAAVRIRQSRAAVESLEEYSRTVELALRVALQNRPGGIRLVEEQAGRRTGAVVFGSDLGLAGRFNIRICDYALERLAGIEPSTDRRAILAVGARVAGQLESQEQPVTQFFGAPDSVDAVTPTVNDLLVHIEKVRAEHDVGRFYLFYNHYYTGATYRPHLVHLFPVELSWLRGLEAREWPTPVRPGFRVPWSPLFTQVVREHLFVSLFEAAVRSQASENASRLASMEAAERRIEERLQELKGRFNQQRQQRITEELMDLVTGFLALEGERNRQVDSVFGEAGT